MNSAVTLRLIIAHLTYIVIPITWSLGHALPLQEILSKSVHNSYFQLSDGQTDRQADKQTDRSENITSFFGGGNNTIMTMTAASHNTVNSLFISTFLSLITDVSAAFSAQVVGPAFSGPAFWFPPFSSPAFSTLWLYPDFGPAFSGPAFSFPLFSSPAFSTFWLYPKFSPAFSSPAFSTLWLYPNFGPPFSVPPFSGPAFSANPTYPRSYRRWYCQWRIQRQMNGRGQVTSLL